MAGEARPIAMGVGGIKFGTVGDGVPGADLKDYPLPTKGSVAFNFADPKEVKIEVEGSEEPFYVELVKDTTDYVEFSIPTPSNEVLKELAGGEVDTTGGKNIWKKPLSTPSISKTFQCETLPKDGKKVVYTIDPLLRIATASLEDKTFLTFIVEKVFDVNSFCTHKFCSPISSSMSSYPQTFLANCSASSSSG